MTPLQMARLECANFDSFCNGKCRLANGFTCKYFENNVLPMKDNTSDKRRKVEMYSAAESYKKMKEEVFTSTEKVEQILVESLPV